MTFLSCHVFLQKAWWPNGEHLKLQIWRCRFGVLLLCCFLIIQETLLHFVPDLHQLIKVCKGVLVMILCDPVFSLIC